jgi:phage regulator Rha-like protein
MKALITQNPITMSSLEIAGLVESRHDSVKRAIDRLVERGVISQPPMVDGAKSANGIVEKQYLIGKRDSYVIVAQLSPEFTARLVDRWQELESNQLALPNFNDPVEAARAWANEVEQKQIAIRTKAEIGSRREATAMNTAAQAVKKLRKLERERNKERIYCTIRRATVLCPNRRFDWRVLKAASAGMELPPIDVHDDLYGKVKAYHADVWLACYGIDVLGGVK